MFVFCNQAKSHMTTNKKGRASSTSPGPSAPLCYVEEEYIFVPFFAFYIQKPESIFI